MQALLVRFNPLLERTFRNVLSNQASLSVITRADGLRSGVGFKNTPVKGGLTSDILRYFESFAGSTAGLPEIIFYALSPQELDFAHDEVLLLRKKCAFRDVPILIVADGAVRREAERLLLAGGSGLVRFPEEMATLPIRIRESLQPVGKRMPVIAKLINPFISATIDLLATMADMTATRKDLFLKKNYRLAGDVSGIMNITGRMEGSVAVTLERGLALEIVSRILHSPASELTEEDIKDGVGELVNIISGNAKASLAGTEYAHEITLPAVIIGYGHEISHPRGAPCIVALFESGAHTFGVQVSVQVKK